MERDLKGVWIPKDIWLNKELSILEKLLITEIDPSTLHARRVEKYFY